MGHKLIVFEGIDNSGKTTISRKILEALNLDRDVVISHILHEHARGDYADLMSSWEGRPWMWTKEPTFTTEEADFLNSGDPRVTEAYREYKFLECRLKNQATYKENNTILDRYLWTGLAYAKVFSPAQYEFVSHMYSNYDLFKKPDLVIFVDTPVELCHEREPAVSIERLTRIRQAYLDTQYLMDCPIVTISGEGSLDKNVEAAMEAVKQQLIAWNSMRFLFLKEFPVH